MSDKLEQFFLENNFDVHHPGIGHEKRFEKLLDQPKSKKRHSWQWLSVAASIVLIFGFLMGSMHQELQFKELDQSPKIEDVENYFVAAINKELQMVEANRSLDTESLIEEALDDIENLAEEYQYLVVELSSENDKAATIHAMINNYQKRLEILQNLLSHIEVVKNPELQSDELFI